MKALSVKQPWASLIAAGVKTIETRTWRTDYRGPLLICSSKIPAPTAGSDPGPCGVALCIADVIDCRPMTEADVAAACVSLYAGAWAWILTNVRLVEPIPVRGQVKFFDVADGLINLLNRNAA
jgi:hypothetical protein